LIFFFQAEDGIRAFHVTGVQTCALPIFPVGKGGGEGSTSLASSPVSSSATKAKHLPCPWANAVSSESWSLASPARPAAIRSTTKIGRASGRERMEASAVEYAIKLHSEKK